MTTYFITVVTITVGLTSTIASANASVRDEIKCALAVNHHLKFFLTKSSKRLICEKMCKRMVHKRKKVCFF